MPVKGEFGLTNGIDVDGSIRKLPPKTYTKLRNVLDFNPEGKNWEALACAVEKDYKITPSMMRMWEIAVQPGNFSSAGKLLTELSSQGMTVKELTNYLHTLKIDTCILGLSSPEDVQIIKAPPAELKVFEGDPLVIEIDSTGRPFPKYQWFFCKNREESFEKLCGKTEKVLRINHVTNENAGTYACQIHNCKDPKKTQITNHTVVSVMPNPTLVNSGLNQTTHNSGLNPTPHNSGLNLPFRHSNEYPYNTNGASQSDSLITVNPKDVFVGMNEPFVLSVQTSGNRTIKYQWYRNDIKLEGEVYSKLTVRHASISDFGKYYCVVSDSYKTEKSNTAFVTEKFPKPERNVEILIVSQPKSVCVNFGGSVLFSCEARCSEPLKYQWFKDGMPLPGEMSSDIKFMNIQDLLVQGFYQCEIFVDKRNENMPRKISMGALLTVEVPNVRDNIEYNPSDKVALLIGNSDYMCHEKLNAPEKDIHMLAESFRALDFRVVSLLNLTKVEIENAVLHFNDLLDKNVYAVFYFCGHGFEEHGMSYLMPNDVPTGARAIECVCAQEILANIQKKEPAVILMILDICRQEPEVKSEPVTRIAPEIKKGNTVFCYATCDGLNAYETRHGGLLVKYLLPLLRKNIGIDALVSEFKGEFARLQQDTDQIPLLVSNLLETQRSLTDKISKKGQTEAFQIRDMIWNAAHQKPDKQRIQFEEVGVEIELDFQAEFSNKLHVFTTVIDHGTTQSCRGKITNFSPPVSQQGKEEVSKEGSRVVSKISLQDIQKLKGNLVVDVNIIFYKDNSLCCLQRSVNLGQPLVSKLRLWEQSYNFTPNSRVAIQQDEE